MKNILLIIFYLSSFNFINSQVLDSITDPRDGKSYRTVTYTNILPNGKSMTWLGRDLVHKMPGSYPRPRSKYRENWVRFYTWKAALKACPSGWHLPTYDEWIIFINNFGGLKLGGLNLKYGPNFFKKSKDSVIIKYKNKNYANNTRLNISLEGYIRPPLYEKRSSNVGYGINSYHWTSSPESSEKAWFIKLSDSYNGVGIESYKKTNAMSVRCVKDY